MVHPCGIYIAADHIVVIVNAEETGIRSVAVWVVVAGERACVIDEPMSVPGSIGVESDNDAGVVYAGHHHAHRIEASRKVNRCEGCASYVEQVSVVIAAGIGVEAYGNVAVVYAKK